MVDQSTRYSRSTGQDSRYAVAPRLRTCQERGRGHTAALDTDSRDSEGVHRGAVAARRHGITAKHGRKRQEDARRLREYIGDEKSGCAGRMDGKDGRSFGARAGEKMRTVIVRTVMMNVRGRQSMLSLAHEWENEL